MTGDLVVNFIRNDYGFDMAFEVNDKNGDNTDLTSATVTFKMSEVGKRATKASGTCTVSDATSGLCYYTFLAADLDTTGEYSYELQIVYATKTITARSTELIVVTEDLV